MFFRFLVIVCIAVYFFECKAYNDSLVNNVSGIPVFESDISNRLRVLELFSMRGQDGKVDDKTIAFVSQSIIDEKLLIQYAKNNDIRIDDLEVNNYIDNYFKSILSQGVARVLDIDSNLSSLRQWIIGRGLFDTIESEIRSRLIREHIIRDVVMPSVNVSNIEVSNKRESLESSLMPLVKIKYMELGDANSCEKKVLSSELFYKEFEESVSNGSDIWLVYGSLHHGENDIKSTVFKYKPGNVVVRSMPSGCYAMEIKSNAYVLRSVLEGMASVKRLDTGDFNFIPKTKNVCEDLEKFAVKNGLESPVNFEALVKELSIDLQDVIFLNKSKYAQRGNEVLVMCDVVKKIWTDDYIRDLIHSYKIHHRIESFIRNLRDGVDLGV